MVVFIRDNPGERYHVVRKNAPYAFKKIITMKRFTKISQHSAAKGSSLGGRLPSLVFCASLLLTGPILTGCSSKKGLGQGGGELTGDAQGTGSDGSMSEYDLATQQEARFGDGSIPTAEGGGMFRDVFFDYDSSSISAEARQDIQENAQLLKEHPGLSIQLEGHCDSRGTEEYNLALGEYRAKAVRDALSALGVPPQQIQTISYGENIPLDPTSSDYAMAKNRRVHFAAQAGQGGTKARYNKDAY
jgi:peptidoglycan-associated lipoprotein